MQDGINDTQQRLLEKRLPRNRIEEERSRDMYTICFLDDAVPSPCEHLPGLVKDANTKYLKTNMTGIQHMKQPRLTSVAVFCFESCHL